MGSMIKSTGGDVKLETEGEMLIQGSTLQSDARDVVLKGGGDKITTTAAEAHNSSKTTFSQNSMTNTVSSAGMSLPTYTDTESSIKGTGVSQTLSTIRAENGTFKIINETGEADLSGVDAVARVVDLTEVQDINLSSAQDRSE